MEKSLKYLENPLYVFDFDDTIIRTDAKVRVYKKDTNETIRFLSPVEFIEFYEPQEDQGAEYLDGEKYHALSYINILKDALSKFGPSRVFICTARHDPEPVKKILEKEGVGNIPVAAVGNKEKVGNAPFHAGRKKSFISMLIKKLKPSIVYFYDDSVANLAAVGSLAKEHNIKIVLVNSAEHNVKTIHPD